MLGTHKIKQNSPYCKLGVGGGSVIFDKGPRFVNFVTSCMLLIQILKSDMQKGYSKHMCTFYYPVGHWSLTPHGNSCVVEL